MEDGGEAVWKALSDPVRRALLDLLRDGPMTTGALAARFEQSRFGVMKHLATLEAAGLLVVERRGRERWNHLNAVALRRATDRWLEPFRAAWVERLAGLERQLGEEASAMAGIPEGLGFDLRFETRLRAPRARVFAALTHGIGDWWGPPYRQAAGSRLVLAPVVGEPLLETGDDGHAVVWARVEEVRMPDRIYLSGRFAVVGAVAGRVHYDLDEDAGGGCVLRVAHTALGPIDARTRASFEAGWRDLVGVRLPAYLAGTPT